MLYEYKGKFPQIDKDCFVAPSADLIGNITVAKGSSIWYHSVIRADIGTVTIGENCSIQDLCVLHVTEVCPIILGDNVTVGHAAVLHGCTIGENSLIGMSATILDNAKIGKNCIIAAGTVVLENAVIPDNSLVAGLPGKVKRTVAPEEAEHLKQHALAYRDLAATYPK